MYRVRPFSKLLVTKQHCGKLKKISDVNIKLQKNENLLKNPRFFILFPYSDFNFFFFLVFLLNFYLV